MHFCSVIASLAWLCVAHAQQDLVNITWAQMDGLQTLPNGDVILAQKANQSEGFCVTSLEVGIPDSLGYANTQFTTQRGAVITPK